MSTTRRTPSMRLLIAAVGLALLAGCAVPPNPSVSPIAAPTQPPQETTMSEPTRPPTAGSPTAPLPVPAPATPELSPAASALGIKAQQDLAGRLNVPADQVHIISVEQSEMPVDTLGCGETGGRQNTGLIIGYAITLAAGGQEYVYHSDGFKLAPCSPANFPGGSPPAAASPAAVSKEQVLAVAHLAQQLGISPDAITVVTIEEVTWPDASLGCPQPGMMYAQVLTPGYRLVLEAAGKTYEYHAGRGRVVSCP